LDSVPFAASYAEITAVINFSSFLFHGLQFDLTSQRAEIHTGCADAQQVSSVRGYGGCCLLLLPVEGPAQISLNRWKLRAQDHYALQSAGEIKYVDSSELFQKVANGEKICVEGVDDSIPGFSITYQENDDMFIKEG
jgi:hypothetical protein